MVLIKLNNILPKAPVAMPLMAATTLGLGDTSMADIDLQVVIRG